MAFEFSAGVRSNIFQAPLLSALPTHRRRAPGTTPTSTFDAFDFVDSDEAINTGGHNQSEFAFTPVITASLPGAWSMRQVPLPLDDLPVFAPSCVPSISMPLSNQSRSPSANYLCSSSPLPTSSPTHLRFAPQQSPVLISPAFHSIDTLANRSSVLSTSSASSVNPPLLSAIRSTDSSVLPSSALTDVSTIVPADSPRDRTGTVRLFSSPHARTSCALVSLTPLPAVEELPPPMPSPPRRLSKSTFGAIVSNDEPAVDDVNDVADLKWMAKSGLPPIPWQPFASVPGLSHSARAATAFDAFLSSAVAVQLQTKCNKRRKVVGRKSDSEFSSFLLLAKQPLRTVEQSSLELPMLLHSADCAASTLSVSIAQSFLSLAAATDTSRYFVNALNLAHILQPATRRIEQCSQSAASSSSISQITPPPPSRRRSRASIATPTLSTFVDATQSAQMSVADFGDALVGLLQSTDATADSGADDSSDDQDSLSAAHRDLLLLAWRADPVVRQEKSELCWSTQLSAFAPRHSK